MEHRIGGLEKEDVTGNVSYEAVNHRKMVALRARKIDGIANDIPGPEVIGPDSGDVLVVGWGSTYGAIAAATGELRREGHSVAHLHLRYIHPLPRNMEEVFRRFRRVLVAETNSGQLKTVLRDQFNFDFRQLNKVEGQPFLIREVRSAIREILNCE